ncbi:broad-range acid phosphatase DET1-like [Hibiscus syriacus]|uniref:Broad-range acid phosphatase DET1-like n=1 Tax=Hibiscus syriacus TaxID=106335 RepID=A0A6A2WS25_HIBSY|nr:broad-range acid phosphatase DET1-like [Hibiscus syriacus]
MRVDKVPRLRYGRFFFRFPNGESVVDVYDRIAGFRETLKADIDIGQFQPPGKRSPNMNLIIVSNGPALRVFLMRCLLMHHSEEELREFGLTDEMLIDQECKKKMKKFIIIGHFKFGYISILTRNSCDVIFILLTGILIGTGGGYETPTVHPPPEVFKDGIAKWRLSLVEHILGAIPKFSALQQIIEDLWKNPYRVLLCRKWEPNMSKLNFDLSRIHIWVHLYNVPLELFSNKGLSYIASAIEIGATNAIPKYIDVILNNGQTTSTVVEVSWIAPCCKICNVFGHSTKGCKHIPCSSQASTLVWRKKEPASTSSLVLEAVSIQDNQVLNTVDHDLSLNNHCKDNEEGNQLGSDSHLHDNDLVDSDPFIITAIYDSNNGILRRQLWQDLRHLESNFSNLPWILGDDFNVIMHNYESSDYEHTGMITFSDMLEFQETTQDLQLQDHSYFGPTFSWSKKQSEKYLARKLDRVLINPLWLESFPHSYVEFMVPGPSDHCMAMVDLSKEVQVNRSKPFKFFNCWTLHPNFLEIVSQSWNMKTIGNPMKTLFIKLKRLKVSLKNLNKDYFSDISARVLQKREELELQQLLTLKGDDPLEKELELQREFNSLEEAESMFLKQKAKVHWLKEGDRCSHDPNVKACSHSLLKDLIQPISSLEDNEILANEVTNENIKEVIFNQGKCEIFTAGISLHTLNTIIISSGFKHGRLPVSYLGVPLITKKLTEKDCQALLDNIKNRLYQWQLILPQSIIKKIEQLCSIFFWKGSDTTVLVSSANNTKQIWEEIRPKDNKVPWHNLIWFPLHVPKHSIISWMAILDWLPTKERLQRFGLVTNDVCIFCSKENETRDHLFATCMETDSIWRSLLHLSGLNRPSSSWSNLLEWAAISWKGRSLISSILKLSWCAFNYTVWEKRN